MVSGILRASVFPTSGYAINAAEGGKMSLPAAPSFSTIGYAIDAAEGGKMSLPAVPSFSTIGYAIDAAEGGKMSLPVAPSAYIYSHFRHVSGVPAPEGSRGVAISKLKILDVLIEQLARIKKNPNAGIAVDTPSDNQIDILIEQYESQIRAVQAVNAAMPYSPAPAVFSGMILDLVA